VLQKIELDNSERVLPGGGHQIAPWGDYAADLFVFNSVFELLGEESNLKFGSVE
jgi:hypothetical protein